MKLSIGNWVRIVKTHIDFRNFTRYDHHYGQLVGIIPDSIYPYLVRIPDETDCWRRDESWDVEGKYIPHHDPVFVRCIKVESISPRTMYYCVGIYKRRVN